MNRVNLINPTSKKRSIGKLFNSGACSVMANNTTIQMCPPSGGTGFIRVNERMRKTGSGGYTPVPYGVAAAEAEKGVSSVSTSYSDYIHYNYGPASKRYKSASDTDEES